MKKILKGIALALAAILLLIQFVRPLRDNPPVVGSETLEAAVEVPADVNAIIKRSCADCHSNETQYPWYSNVAPFSWLLADHIDDGRKELNFSKWNTYDARKRAHKLEEICEMVNSSSMPLPSYLWIHSDAALSADDSKKLCDWATAERAKLQGS